VVLAVDMGVIVLGEIEVAFTVDTVLNDGVVTIAGCCVAVTLGSETIGWDVETEEAVLVEDGVVAEVVLAVDTGVIVLGEIDVAFTVDTVLNDEVVIIAGNCVKVTLGSETIGGDVETEKAV